MVKGAIGIRNTVFAMCLYAWCMFPASTLFAAGKTEQTEQKPLNNEWILCVTAFDSSALSLDRRIVADVVTRSLVDTFRTVSYRIRISPEYAFYEGYEWSKAVNTAAKALSQKQDERSLLLYRGDPDWKYRQGLKKLDTDIAKLREELAKKEAEKPLINSEPVFNITQDNRGGVYPVPPEAGGEYLFCRTQTADAFLAGSIREYHGRYYITLRLYTLYTRSFVYEDNIIFSTEDTTDAVEEIAGRLTAVLSGSKPAAIAVRSEPAESLVLINRNFAGRGTVEAREHPPGKVVVSVSADTYKTESLETDLVPGELAEFSVSLSPLRYGDININTAKNTGGSVYQGALYVGEAPLTLRLPLNQLDYINIETKEGETAKAVFLTPELSGDAYTLSLKTRIPPPTGQRRVNKARSLYYWSWAGTWITGIAAWVSYGIYSSQNSALPESASPAFFEDTQRLYYISLGAIILVGAAAAYDLFQMTRYLYIATEDTTPIVRQEKKKK